MPSERVQRQIDSLLDEAEAAIKKKEWQTVAARARAVLRLDAENIDVSRIYKRPGRLSHRLSWRRIA